jgi:class 3 adenylate cyclase/alpha-beta hydrolase superfamily lysophospholipase
LPAATAAVETNRVPPHTRYAVTEDGVYIAYQTIGDGPVDLVFVHSFVSHVELFWELPSFERFVRELSSRARVILFDKRGVGLSDRLSSIPTLEARMDDLRAVLDATGSKRPLLIGDGDGGALATLFAATYPERTLGLLLWSGAVRMAWAPDYPWGMSQSRFEERLRTRTELWGDAARAVESTRMTFTTIGDRLAEDPSFVQWLVKLQRYGAAPGDLVMFSRVWFSTDARSALPAIQVPVLVLVREGWPPGLKEESAWTADRIPGAQLMWLHGDEDDPYLGDVIEVAQAVERFVSSIREEQAVFDRVLATVLFTDIVRSTDRASASGDREWKDLVEQHHARTRALISRFRGHEVDTAGDGFFATFDGPGRAVHCAQSVIRSVAPLGIQVRAGIHTGEVETIDGKAGGVAVMIGARIGALASPSEILASPTVRDLTAGSGLVFEDAGEYELRGVPDRWHLYRVVSGS